jgi:hypothetical protein
MKQIDPSGKGRTVPAVLKKDALRPAPARPVYTPGAPSGRQNLPTKSRPIMPNITKSPKPKATNKPAFNKEAAKKSALAAFRSKKGK